MRWSRWSLVLLVAAALMVGVGTAGLRSTVPRSIQGTVTSRSAEPDGPLPSETAYFVAVDGKRLQVDQSVYAAVRVGDLISKARWSTSLATPRGIVRMRASRDTRNLALTAFVLIALAALLVRQPRR